MSVSLKANSTAKSNLNWLMDFSQEISTTHNIPQNELPDSVPLDLPILDPPEETLTHQAKLTLSFERAKLDRHTKSMIVCAGSNKELKFKFHCEPVQGCNQLCNELSISYLSLPNLFVDFSVICLYYSELDGKKFCIMNERISKQLSRNDSLIEIEFVFDCFRNEDCLSLYDFDVKDVEISLKMTIYKESSRKLGFPEMKSLSRVQTLLDLKSMLDGGKHCDVVVLVDGEQFITSKAILTAQSPVFKAMFCHDSKVESQVSLTDVTSDVFEQFLHYFYSGKVSSRLKIENVNELLLFSERHSTGELSQICVKFIVDYCVENNTNN